MSAARRWRGADANELAVDPELGALVLLDAALAVALESLMAFVPELDPKARTWYEPSSIVLAARQIVVHARHLRELLGDYRARLDGARAGDDVSFC